MQTNGNIHPANDLSPSERDCLLLIARLMIPPSAEFGLPGADDPAIIARVLQLLERDAAEFKRRVGDVAACFAPSNATLSPVEQIAQVDRLRRKDSAGFAIIESAIARAYYSDDRVMASIGMEPRPPFPAGYAIDQATDWSLLEPVKQRGRVFRQAPK